MNIKKIIAREGLIVVTIISISLLFILVLSNIPDMRTYTLKGGESIQGVVWDDYKERMVAIGFSLLLFCYPIYLLGRFVFWAIRTLKVKE